MSHSYLSHVLAHSDGTISQDETQLKNIWKVRESAPEGVLHAGKPYKYDLSLPLESFYELVTETRKLVGSRATVVGYGHVGDSNLHLNVGSDDPDILGVIEPFIWEFVQKVRSSL